MAHVKPGWLMVGVGSALLYLPSLLLPWSLIDDGESVLVSRSLSGALGNRDWTALFSGLVEPSRARPAYWLGQWFVHVVAGDNPAMHHALRVLGLALVVGLMGYLLHLIGSGAAGGWIAAALLVLAPASVENWYRLGTAEPEQLLLLLVATVLLAMVPHLIAKGSTRAVVAIACVSLGSLAVGVLAKETSVAMVAPIAVLWLVSRHGDNPRNARLFAWFLLGTIVAVVAFVAFMLLAAPRPAMGGDYYAAMYSLEPPRIWRNATAYWSRVLSTYAPFLVLSAAASCWRAAVWVRNGRPPLSAIAVWQLFGLTWFGAFLAIQLPWEATLDRYLLPSLVGLSIWVGATLGGIFGGRQPGCAATGQTARPGLVRLLALTFLALAFAYFVAVNGIRAWNFVADYSAREQANAAAVALTAREAGPESTVHLNMTDDASQREWSYEFGLHLRLFYSRDDLKVRLLDLERGRTPERNGDLVLTWTLFNRYPIARVGEWLGTGGVDDFQIVREATLVGAPAAPMASILDGLANRDPARLTRSVKYAWQIGRRQMPAGR